MENTKGDREFRITGFVMVDGYWYGYRRTPDNQDVDEVTYMSKKGLRVVQDSGLFYRVVEQAKITDPALRLAQIH